MQDSLVKTVKGRISEFNDEIEKAPIKEVALLGFVLHQYEGSIIEFAEFCDDPGTSPIIPGLVQKRVEEMMYGLNNIADRCAPVIEVIRKEAGALGRDTLAKIFSGISDLVRTCLLGLIKLAKASLVDVGIQGYTIGVGVGGLMTFGVNFSLVEQE